MRGRADGRAAHPVPRAGRYEGFDIVRGYVRWCRRAITPRWPNFRFTRAHVFNREYNPRDPVKAGEYRLPYPDGAFDFAFLTSVFTHLPPPDAAHYPAGVGRVLRPGGRALATFFLLNDGSNRLVDAGRGHFALHPADGPYRVRNRDIPEECLALDEGFVEGAARAAGLGVDRPVRYGRWCGRTDGYDYQDILILRKT